MSALGGDLVSGFEEGDAFVAVGAVAVLTWRASAQAKASQSR